MTNPADIVIGASDVSGILGLSPWQSPSAVWARLKGLTESQPSDATRRGHTLELGILLEYADRHMLKLYRWDTSHRHLHRLKPPYRAGVYRGPSIEEPRIQHYGAKWAGCRPDAIVLDENGKKHLVEVKTTRSFRDWQDAEGNAILPPHYVVQVQWQLFVMGMTECDVEAFCTFDDSRRSYHVKVDFALQARITQLVKVWRDKYLLGDDLPPDMPADIAGLVWPAPQDPETWIEPTAEDQVMAHQYAQLSERIKASETEREAIKSRLCTRIQDNTGIKGIASWKATKRGRTFRLLTGPDGAGS